MLHESSVLGPHYSSERNCKAITHEVSKADTAVCHVDEYVVRLDLSGGDSIYERAVGGPFHNFEFNHFHLMLDVCFSIVAVQMFPYATNLSRIKSTLVAIYIT